MKEFLTQTDVLARDYWNRRVLKALLGEADEVKYRDNGQVLRRNYLSSRVLEAEKTDYFQARVKHVDDEQKAVDQRKRDLDASLCYSIDSDMKNLSVPQAGSFLEVFDDCRSRMKMYDDIIRILPEHDLYQFGGPDRRGLPRPDKAICRKIARQRPDLAFEAGIFFLDRGYNIGYARETIKELEQLRAEEQEAGEEIHLI